MTDYGNAIYVFIMILLAAVLFVAFLIPAIIGAIAARILTRKPTDWKTRIGFFQIIVSAVFCLALFIVLAYLRHEDNVTVGLDFCFSLFVFAITAGVFALIDRVVKW